MGTSRIEWTDMGWPIALGCDKITNGCRGCYAEREDNRWHAYRYGEAFVPWFKRAQREAGRSPIKLFPDKLDYPRHWQQPDECYCGHPPEWHNWKPQEGEPACWTASERGVRCECEGYVRRPLRIFVDALSDLFHEDVPMSFLLDVWRVMADCPQHEFQILTKRPWNAAAFTNDVLEGPPLPNVDIGTSITGERESGPYLDWLSQINAAVRFVSYEPALRAFDFRPWLPAGTVTCTCEGPMHRNANPRCAVNKRYRVGIDWLVIGAESGPEARPFHLEWAADAARQAQDAEVPVFVKQLGAHPRVGYYAVGDVKRWAMHQPRMVARKPDGSRYVKRRDGVASEDAYLDVHLANVGRNLDDFPIELRVREFPQRKGGWRA